MSRADVHARGRSRPVTARAPAKVNLLLQSGPRRADGYHELLTVFQALSLADDVTAAPAPEWGVSVEAAPRAAAPGEHSTGPALVDLSGVPLDETNLALQAALLLARETGAGSPVHLTIRKGVPVAGGMAGGSADAAAALVACDALWGTGLALDDLAELGAELGSDVPFAVHGRTAVGTGRGERLVPVLTSATWAWVLVPAGHELSTPKVYAEFDALVAAGRVQAGAEPGERLRAVEAALRAGDPRALGAALGNDLEAAACSLAPALTETLAAGRAAGAVGAIVSGSGPTVALLTESTRHARTVAERLRAQGRRALTAVAPAPGAHVLEPVLASVGRPTGE
ncbi:4-diphosphocytidyl-2-C-methyl-D-erythritol kinase [Kineococcus xinjiangensis]|uniref:4-diphosphocytidyl-2-C-methyl-D-erythritol kinase n=1 Tax=Kineococcus xinjiangensis TaxID=512762 RepID=A0A2S6IT83_9ACTN|nr:4-(cytidine 5'-diphospho)-2-C-methyl-D-erythritol kinase [Kineococcus xinjiangensis]PPK97256.1 4-diphosphocytidyl-2-C-methyl-D-erythritol kinase [Kineococcus xinjiangensis]